MHIAASEAHINEDIANVMRALLATHEATRRFQRDTPELNAYSAGFRDAFLLLAAGLNVHLGIPTARDYADGW